MREYGEQVGNGGFFQSMEVDKTQFVKLYVDGVSAIEGLSSSGKKVFKILYLAIRDNKDTDTILMSFDIVDQDIVKISRTTYFKGMKELADKKFIAETMIQNYYFINPDYMFNGDRLTFMKTYYLKDKKKLKLKRTKLIAKAKHSSFKKEIFSSNSYLNDNSIKPMHFNKLPPYYKNCIG